MLTKLTYTSYQNILQVDQERIEELQSLVAQNRASGNPVDKFLKELVLAYEKQIKHQIEFNQWCKEHDRWCAEHNCNPDQLQETTSNQSQTEKDQSEAVQTSTSPSTASVSNQSEWNPFLKSHTNKKASRSFFQYKYTPQHTAHKSPP